MSRHTKFRWRVMLVVLVGVGVIGAMIIATAPGLDSPRARRMLLPNGRLVEARPSQTVGEVITGPFKGEPVYPVKRNIDVRDLPQVGPTVKDHLLPELEMPGRETGEGAGLGVPVDDPVAQKENGPIAMPSPLQGFTGLDFSGWGAGWPPDTNGDVGPVYYIQTVNTSIGIYNKATGARVAAFTFDTFFDGTGTPCDADNMGDPIVLYDAAADRWIVTDFAWSNLMSGPYYECIAISQTGDPVSGGWYQYAYVAHNTYLADYPKLGVWPDGYYMSMNLFDCLNSTCGSATWQGVRVYAFNRTNLLAGQPLTSISFNLSAASLYGALLPSNLRGTPPPAGSPNYFVSADENWLSSNDVLHLWKFHVDWATPANSTFTGPTDLVAASFVMPTSSVPTQGGTALDTLGDRLMMQLQYRNIGGTESLWVNHTVNSGGVMGIRWYELRAPNATPVIYQQGTYQPDSTYRWMGSIAVDRLGNAAIGYSASSASMYPAIRYTGRLASDPLGQLPQGETTLIAGTGSQTTYSRWGDYSAMSVDPVDDCTFWYTTEYYAGTGTNWQTYIGSFRFPTCLSTPTPAISLDKTVGTDPATCAASDSLSVGYGSGVTYCYRVTNTGNVTLTIHSLVDDRLGTLLNNFNYTLPPLASTFVTQTVALTTTTVNSATWTTTYLTYTVSASDMATVTVVVTPTITVAPNPLSYTQAVNTVVTRTLTINNSGPGSSLIWSITEGAHTLSTLTTWIPTAATIGSVDVTTARDSVLPETSPDLGLQLDSKDYYTPSRPAAGVLYSSGPLVNSPGTGSGGADESVLQNTSLGMGTLGFGDQLASNNSVADDFTVPPGGWHIDTLEFYAYQTGSGTTSTINNVRYQIWNGAPNAGGSIIYGNLTANRLISSTFSNIYRVSQTTSGNNQRPIMRNVVAGNFDLPPGTYWIQWTMGGTLASGPWAPPITINGQSTTGNGLQNLAGTWGTATDVGSQGFPFIINGTAGSVNCATPSDTPWLTVSPTSGTTTGGNVSSVNVGFNTTGLTNGNIYTATLCVNSNDRVRPLVEVPVTLTVSAPPPLVYAHPSDPTCGGNSPCYSGATAIQQALTAVAVNGQVIVLNDHATNTTLTCAGNVTVSGTTGASITWTGAADSLFTAQNCDLQVKGLILNGGSTATIFNQVGTGTIIAYANNISSFATAYSGSGTHNLGHNYWGTSDPLAAAPAGFSAGEWAARLGAPIASWSEGTGTTTLVTGANTAILNGGSGTAVIVSHGRGQANAPFGNGVAPYVNQMCSDFYDLFTVNGSGMWTAQIPVDNTANCNANTLTPRRVAWITALTQCSPATNAACWNALALARVSVNGQNLLISNLTVAELGGTPFVAGDPSGDDPTAVSLTSLTAQNQSDPAGLLIAGIFVLFSMGVTLLMRHRRFA